MTGKKSPVVRMLKDASIQIGNRKAKLNFLVIEGSPYDVIIGDPTREIISGVISFGNQVASFIIDSEKVEILMELDYVPEDPRYSSGTDRKDFTCAS